jgi:uncharacterized protein
MSLKSKIDADIKAAMLAKEAGKLLALRDIKKLILLEETKPGGGELTEADELKILQKAVKQRKDAADIYKTQNRPDLLEKEEAEIGVIEVYLPAQMSREDIETAVRKAAAEIGASGPADMGKLMGASNKALAGQAEGKVIAEVVKAVLASL